MTQRKSHARRIYAIGQNAQPKHEPITFTMEDVEEVSYPYDKPMVITAIIDGFTLK